LALGAELRVSARRAQESERELALGRGARRREAHGRPARLDGPFLALGAARVRLGGGEERVVGREPSRRREPRGVELPRVVVRPAEAALLRAALGQEIDDAEERDRSEEEGEGPARSPARTRPLRGGAGGRGGGERRARAPADSEHAREGAGDRRELEAEVEARVREPGDRAAERAGRESARLAPQAAEA